MLDSEQRCERFVLENLYPLTLRKFYKKNKKLFSLLTFFAVLTLLAEDNVLQVVAVLVRDDRLVILVDEADDDRCVRVVLGEHLRRDIVRQRDVVRPLANHRRMLKIICQNLPKFSC